ncbi:MAG TPA: hypothetical protein VIK32_06145, partial [Candidatus Limnocylindrales bacterium]
IGGGATSRLWPQIVSDMTGLAQEIPVRTAGAAFGSAYVAGLATGLVAEGELERSWIKVAGVIEPDLGNRERYETLYARFRQLYAGTRRVVHELASEAGVRDG